MRILLAHDKERLTSLTKEFLESVDLVIIDNTDRAAALINDERDKPLILNALVAAKSVAPLPNQISVGERYNRSIDRRHRNKI